jgi:hypothetical protein
MPSEKGQDMALTPAVEPVLNAPRNLADGIRFLKQHKVLCDIFLMVGEETFPAHQTMLSAMSPAFGKVIREAASELRAQSETVAPSLATAPGATPSPSLVMETAEQKDPETCRTSTAGSATKEALQEPASMEVDTPPTRTIDEADSPKPFKFRVRGVTHPETVRILLDYIYQVGTSASWEYSPSDIEVNKEILHLSRQFELKQLHEYAARWLARGVTASNLVERLVICEEFKLGRLREKLIEQLAAHPPELSTVCRSTEVLAHPRILQELLVQVSSLIGMERHGSMSQKRDSTDEASEKAVDKTSDEVHERKLDKHEKEKVDKTEKEEKKVDVKATEKPLKKKRIA